MSNDTESIRDAGSSADLSRQMRSELRGHLLLKRICIGLFLITSIYLFSYGPMVMNAVNKYGQRGTGLRAFYKPAHQLANHSAIYGDYRFFWVKQSHNYHWWARRNSAETNNVFLPPRRRAHLTAYTRYQPPPDPSE